jgi:N-formylglutamate amidohydrolase
MILHIPHASTETLGREFLCDLSLELERMTDHYTDKLFDHPEAERIVFPVSRLVCDVERFEDDAMEQMAAYGMGVCYTRNALGEPLRRVTPEERAFIVEHYYRPHHRRLSDAVDRELERRGHALLVDCHSFPDEPLPCNISQTTPRPDICIGTDAFHTPESLVSYTKEFFISRGYSVAIDDPFHGTLIPMKHYHKDPRVSGIMLEVNRRVYRQEMEPLRGEITRWLEGFQKIV